MSRALGQILTIASTAALIATGVGAVGGLAFFGSISSISIGTVGLGTLLTASAVLGAAAQLLGGGAQAQKPQTTESAIRAPPPAARSRIWGVAPLRCQHLLRDGERHDG